MTVELFNATLLQLLNELYSSTQNKKFRKFYILIKNFLDEEDNKKTKFIEQYILSMLEHKEKIMKKDETFYLTYQFRSDVSYMNEMYDLRGVLNTLSEENKQVVFDYFIALTEFAENYFLAYLKTER